MQPLLPLDTAPLFAPLHSELMSVLGGLTPEEWERPTLAKAWRVRDVAAHLLDTQLRRLSSGRDGHLPPPEAPIAGHGDLVSFLNGLNASWVAAARRLSPRVLTELLAVSGPTLAAFFAALPKEGRALFGVAWAGEQESETWFDVGREYTEWWHHQMQIRDAVGAPLLLGEPYFRPLLELSLRALPRAYAGAPAPDGASLRLEIAGEALPPYTLLAEGGAWRVLSGGTGPASCVVSTDADTAWRLLYNALDAEGARARVRVAGDAALAAPLLAARSVMV